MQNREKNKFLGNFEKMLVKRNTIPLRLVAVFCVVILVMSGVSVGVVSTVTKEEKTTLFQPGEIIDGKDTRSDPTSSLTGYEPWFYYIGDVVHSATGNLYFSELDLSAKARGFNIEILRSYNSHNHDVETVFGNGWTFNYNTYLIDSGSYIRWIDGDGSAHYFRNEGGGIYSPPAGIHAQIKKIGETYILREKTGTVYSFNSDGVLTEIEDKNGNSLTFTYGGAGITSVSDDSEDESEELSLSPPNRFYQ